MMRIGPIAVVAIIVAATPAAAAADDECVVTATGIECSYSGTNEESTSTPGASLPPLRYLATRVDSRVGACWHWSRYPPGLDSWDAGNDAAIIFTRAELPRCPAGVGTFIPPESTVVLTAWDVFRRFPLAAPEPRLQPADAGITGLPSYVWADLPAPLTHSERLPDGTSLEVRAAVTGAVVDWGDGSPARWHEPDSLRPHPEGQASNTYGLKTCTAAYRTAHPSGANCHPSLEHYLVSVTFVWSGSYRHGGATVQLGDLHRTATVAYDVDEVVGVLQP